MMNPAEFANIAESEANFWWYRGMRKIMFRMLDPIAHQRKFTRVAEIGAGTGHFARELEQRYGWKMFPLDLGWEGLAYARQYGVERLVQADMCRLPYATGTLDALVSMDVIVHLPRGEEDKPMSEFARVLRPGGFAAIRVSALDILRSQHSEFAHERQRFTRSRLLDLAARHGFRPLRTTYANSLLLPVALFKFRVWEPLTASEPESGVKPVPQWLDTLLYTPLALEAAWIGIGGSFPLGQSIVLLAEKRS
ncbi:MAG: methyltransferase domain-containing protein [Bryobacteraceae bacterium]